MGQFNRIVIASCLALLLAACAGTSAVESQSKQRDARQARLYFLREKGIVGALGGPTKAAEVKVDGKAVGTVTNGSYIFVDRPPGSHQLSLENGVSMAFETDVEVEAGREYFFNIGVPSTGAPGQVLLNQAFAGGSGQPMTPRSRLSYSFSGAMFYTLDPAAGAAALQSLKPP